MELRSLRAGPHAIAIAVAIACVACARPASEAMPRASAAPEAAKPGAPADVRSAGSGGSGPRTAVTARGHLEPDDGIAELAGAPGDRVARVLVTEGQLVEAGSPIAELESHGQRLAEKNQIASQLEEAKRRLAAESARARAAVREAEAALREVQEVGLEEVRLREAEHRRQASAAALAKKEHEALAATKQHSAPLDLFRREIAVERAEAELAMSAAALERARRGREVGLVRAKAAVELAHAELDRAQSIVPVDSLAKSLAAAEERLRQASILAPRTGHVIRLETRPGESSAGILALLGDTRRMAAVAEVYETDVRFIAVGQPATVTSRALARDARGKVAEIRPMVRKNRLHDLDPTAEADARVVEVKVQLEEDEALSRLTNLQVDVRISLEPAPR